MPDRKHYRPMRLEAMVRVAESTGTYVRQDGPFGGSYICPRCQERKLITMMCICGGGDCFLCCPDECGLVHDDDEE